MSKPLYNFGAGPACLPPSVLEQIKNDIPDWYEGMSVMELSHRIPVTMELFQQVEASLRQLLNIPHEFAVLFMQGGARAQFAAVPMNLLQGKNQADYLVTGMWSELAYIEAKKYGDINCAATGTDHQFTQIPERNTWKLSQDSSYFHYTDNETIHGVEFAHTPDVGQWLVSDMTSNLLTRPIDFSKMGLIYASAQKNLGIAGITVVIVRKELLNHAHPFTPAVFHYELFEKSQSLYNTPPVFCWYVTGLMLDWAKTLGGIEQIAKLCEQKSNLIYDVVDNSQIYVNHVNKADRSRVNIPFSLRSEAMESQFLAAADAAGLKQLKGHKVVGGCRASLYNAMPLAGAQALANFMRDFEKSHS